ncbi:MAG TPA: hypothetical protein VI702_05435, partial [Nitrospiria bacterium]
RSHEAAGALNQARRVYEDFQRNYPASSHQYEAGLRIAMLKDLTAPKPTPKSYPRRSGWFLGGRPDQTSARLKKLSKTPVPKGTRTVVLPGYGPNGVFFKTDQAPSLGNHLADQVRQVHALGMQAWAQMPSRRLPWFKAAGEERDQRYDPVLQRRVPTASLDLFNASVIERLKSFYLDLAGTGIDGILFDDEIFIEPGEGFGAAAQGAYARDFGEPPDPALLFGSGASAGGVFTPESAEPHYWRWAGWKSRENLIQMGGVFSAVRAIHPNLVWARIFPLEALAEPHRALARAGFDLAEERLQGADYFGVRLSLRQDGTGLSGILTRAQVQAGQKERIFAVTAFSERPQGLLLSEVQGVGLMLQ